MTTAVSLARIHHLIWIQNKVEKRKKVFPCDKNS